MGRSLRVLMISDISGEGPEYHVGDEAMAEVAIDRISGLVGNSKIYMACSSPEGIPGTYGIRAVPYYNLEDRVRRARWKTNPFSSLWNHIRLRWSLFKVDVVFVCGGGNITSQWPGVMESRLYLIEMAKRSGKRVFLVSQTLGPYESHHHDRALSVLSDIEWIGVRDRHFSYKHAGQSVHYAVDDACFLGQSEPTQLMSELRVTKPFIAVSLRKLGSTSDRQLRCIGTQVAEFARKQNLLAVFIPHHAPAGRGDFDVAEMIKDCWEESDEFRVIAPIPLAKILKAVTAKAELTITMRYHQLIFSLSTGVPAVGIYSNEYTEAKLRGAFEQFGLDPILFSVEDNPEDLRLKMDAAVSVKQNFKNAAEVVLERGLSDNIAPYEALGRIANR